MAEEIPTCAQLGCSSLTLEWWEPCSFKADPDIAGIGVILSFAISMSLTFLLALYGFYFVKNSFAKDSINRLDDTIIETVQKLVKKLSNHDQQIITQDVFRETILQFSDTQLVTGLAILLIGFGKTDTITAYHFSVVGDLANMAFVVHLSTIDIVAKEFEGRPQSWWRVFGIVAIALLTFASTIPWLNKYFLSDKFGAPVRCVWSSIPGNTTPYQTTQAAVYLLFQLWAIATILYCFFPTLFDKQPFKFVNAVSASLLSLPDRAYRHANGKVHASHSLGNDRPTVTFSLWKTIARLTFGASFLTFLATEIAFSQAFQLMRNWAFLVLNLKEVFEFRAESNKEYQYKEGDEDAWGFGQLVPLLLLILPISTLCEVWFDAYFKRKAEEAKKLHDLQEKLNQEGREQTNLSLSPETHEVEDESAQKATPSRSNTMERGRIVHAADDQSTHASVEKRHASEITDFTALYEKRSFRITMKLIMFGLFIGTTVAEVFGWSL